MVREIPQILAHFLQQVAHEGRHDGGRAGPEGIGLQSQVLNQKGSPFLKPNVTTQTVTPNIKLLSEVTFVGPDLDTKWGHTSGAK